MMKEQLNVPIDWRQVYEEKLNDRTTIVWTNVTGIHRSTPITTPGSWNNQIRKLFVKFLGGAVEGSTAATQVIRTTTTPAPRYSVFEGSSSCILVFEGITCSCCILVSLVLLLLLSLVGMLIAGFVLFTTLAVKDFIADEYVGAAAYLFMAVLLAAGITFFILKTWRACCK